MQLIYYAHSYRQSDDDVNEFFQELMVDEALTPSLDPPSQHLNAAKPERHLRCTDAMVVVLPWRDSGPSEYIRWEVSLGMRARKPQLVFVEDSLPDALVPADLLQRRFSRGRLLREARDHRHAVRMLKSYIGTDPPPSCQLVGEQRRCVVIGAQHLGMAGEAALLQCLRSLNYKPLSVEGGGRVSDGIAAEHTVQRASLCIALLDDLTTVECYLLGIARAALTPTIALTLDAAYAFHAVTPREYQPRQVAHGDIDDLLNVVKAEVAVFEEDYLELKEEAQVRRYKEYRESVLRVQRKEGVYTDSEREQIVNYIQNAEIDMSKDKVQVSHVVGPVNIKARLEHVTQTVQQTTGLPDDRRAQLALLVDELRAALEPIATQRPEDAERVAQTAELVATEATKGQPNKGFLSLTAAGLKEAAKAVADIAPTVLTVADKIAAFVAALT